MRNPTSPRRLTTWLTPRLGLEALEGRVNPVVVPVTPNTLAASGWQLTASDGNPAPPPPSVVFEAGPATPPAGAGSLEFRISALGNDAAQARLTTLGGTLLSDLTAVSYSTYVDQNNGGLPGNGGQAPYLIVSVDYDNNGTSDDLLFFEPVYQGATFFPTNPQGPLALDTWQTWDALNGGWYSVNGTAGSGPGANVKPLSTFFTPALGGDADATIVNTASGLGGFRVVTGFGGPADWGNFIGNVDNVTVDTAAAAPVTTFDFDLPTTVYVDDTFANPVVGQDPDGAGPATNFGSDSFATIQEGVNASAPGGTVIVAAGTYPENVTVDRAVTLLGAQANVAPTGRTLGGAAESTVNPAAGGQVFQVAADGVVINGFTITTTGVTTQGVNETTGLAGTTVVNNLISGFTTSVGVAITAGSTGSVVRLNDISNNYAGVYLSANATGATVSQNDIHNNVDLLAAGGDAGSAIVLEGDNTGVSITQNFLRDNAGAGVYVFNLGPSLTGTQLFNNSITGNADGGVVNTNTAVLDAPGNWWGTATAAGVAAAAGPNVDFSPWLTTGTDTSAAFGFQGDFSNLGAGAAPPAGAAGQIQQAIDLAAPGATITLINGTYAECNILVDKPLTIQGQSEAGVLVVPDGPDANEDSSFGGAFCHAFIVQSDNVTIRTLTIDGDPTDVGVYGFRTGIITDFFFTPGPYDDLTVQDVTVNDVYRRGVQLSDVSTGNSITGVTVDDVGLATENGIGIASFSGAGTISNNTVTNAFTGIAVNFADPNAGTAPTQVTIQGNDVTVRNATAGAGGIGLSLYGLLGGSLVSGNTVTLTADADADTGILFADARGGPTTISGNTVLASGGDRGIIVSETSATVAPVITGNTFTATGSTAGGVGRGVAIFLTDDNALTGSASGDTFATISNNTITGFVTGVQLLDSATAPADTTTVNATIAGQTLTGLTNGLLATGGGGTLGLTNVTITNNTAVGLQASGFDSVTISGLTLTGNGGAQSIATTPGGTIDFVATTGATPFTITASGTQLVAGPTGGTANQPIALSGEANLNLTGGSGADTFNVIPPATGTTITVTGGLPTTLPGDVLDLDFTGATGTALTTTGSPTGFSGSYTFTNRGTVAFTGIETLADAATVRGRVYNDADRDGTADPGEGGVVGVPVRLDFNADGTVDQTATTDALGNYSFATLAPGTYRVSVDTAALPAGATVAPAAQQTITAGEGATTTADFGVQSPTGSTAGTTVTGVVFNDANQNGVREAGEVGVNGLTVFLDLDNDGRLDPNEPATVSAAVNGQAGAYTLFTTQGGTVAAVRVVEQPGFVTNTTGTAVVLNGTTQTVDVGVFANIPPQTPPSRQFAVAGTVVGRTTVRVYNPDGMPAYELPGGTGDLRVAVGDVTGDGVEDVVIGSGIGAASLVRVIDGVTRQQVASFSPFEASFTGGVYVALGDLTGDGVRDVVVTPDQGGGPRVVVYQGGAVGSAGAFTQVASFFGIQDPAFRGGARAAVGDVNADGRPDLAVSAGFLGGPRIAVYDGTTILSGAPGRLVNDFFAFEDTLRNGAYVAIGDLNGDGFGDLIFGAGPGGAPRVLAISGQLLLSQGSTAALAAPLANFFGGDPANRAGIRVAAKDLDGDGRADFLTAGGSGTTVAAYDGQDLTVLFTLSSGSDPLGAFNGVFVG